MWRIRPIGRDDQLRRYQDAAGADARLRQEALARMMHSCCGEPKDGGHHEACSKRPAEAEVPEVVDGQMSLA